MDKIRSGLVKVITSTIKSIKWALRDMKNCAKSSPLD